MKDTQKHECAQYIPLTHQDASLALLGGGIKDQTDFKLFEPSDFYYGLPLYILRVAVLTESILEKQLRSHHG